MKAKMCIIVEMSCERMGRKIDLHLGESAEENEEEGRYINQLMRWKYHIIKE